MFKKWMMMIAILLYASLTACSSKAPKEPEMANQGSYDVVVVGSGGAGLAAAIEAYDAGANVLILEKMPIAGGNTTRATGGMNASSTKFQQAEGIVDDNAIFYEDTMKGGYEKNDPELVKYMTDNSAAAIEWLNSLGITLNSISTSGGQSVKRTHRPADGSAVGDFIVNGLLKQVKSRNIEIRFQTMATKLIVKDNQVVGVEVESASGKGMIDAKAVVMSTGGFGANFDLIVKYRPELKDYVTTNHAGATGDGITMIEEIGGALVGMEEIQIHPTVEQSTASLITESTRGDGGILVNQKGERFTNELLTRDKVSAAVIALPEKYAYVVFNQRIVDESKAIEKYTKQDFCFKGTTIEELADVIGADPAVLKTTMDTWNEAVAKKEDAAFGRTTGMDFGQEEGPYYAIKIAPGIHHTMGGIKINTNTEVLKADGSAISALYAAGELTGGVHGGNRLGGNAVTDIMVFGRQAGLHAAAYAKEHGAVGHVNQEKPNQGEKELIKKDLPATFIDGVYMETVKGHNADIVVEVTVEGGYIVKIAAIENEETATIFAGVEEQLIPEIIYQQSADVDAIASATVSSNAIKEAVQKVIEKAKR